jgi:Tol biopolymer transport system component
VRAEARDKDVLVAHDLASGDEQVITNLASDGSSGWEIAGYALSPDRRRIAIASLYGPTKEDTATGLATNAIWTLAVDGTDFRRLTPTFSNNSNGRSNFSIDVTNPMWTADGANVLYSFGNYWWEGTKLAGGSVPWIVSAAGDALPSSWSTPLGCSVIYPSRHPTTGEMLLIHSVCVPGSGEDGIYLYPADGGTNPTKLVASSRAANGIDIFLGTPSWLSDGSGFLYIGSTAETDWTPSILAYDIAKGTSAMLLPAPAGSSVMNVALSPDGSKIVYCLRNNDTAEHDLHVVDISTSTPTDTAITNDGKSCYASF